MDKLNSHPFLQLVESAQQALIKADDVNTRDFIAMRPCQVLKSCKGKPLMAVFFGPDASTTSEQGLLMSMKAGEARLTCDMVGMLSKNGASFGFHVTFLQPGKACVDFLQKKTNSDRAGEQLNEINIISQFDTMTFDYDMRTGRKMRLTTVVDASTGGAKTLVNHQLEGVGLKRENLRLEMRFTPERHSRFAAEFSEACYWCQDRLISVDIPETRRHTARSLSRSRSRRRSRSLSSRRIRSRSDRRRRSRRLSPARRDIFSRISRSASPGKRSVPDWSRRRKAKKSRSDRSCSRSVSRSRKVARRNRSVSRDTAMGRPGDHVPSDSSEGYNFIVKNLKVGKLVEGELAQRLSCRDVVLDLDYRSAQTWTIDLGVADFQLAPEPSASVLAESYKANADAKVERVKKDLRQFKADECVICLSEPVAVTLVPCGHRCVCKDCCGFGVDASGPRIGHCALCRKRVDAYLLH